MTDLHDKACPSRGAFLAMIDNMRSEGQNSRAEAVTSLLAENERLEEWVSKVEAVNIRLEAENERLTNALAERQAHWRDAVARAEAAEAACENLGVTPQQAAEGLARFKAREARIAELEARYKALCEGIDIHERYAGLNGDRDWCAQGVWLRPGEAVAVVKEALIPRPSMEVKP